MRLLNVQSPFWVSGDPKKTEEGLQPACRSGSGLCPKRPIGGAPSQAVGGTERSGRTQSPKTTERRRPPVFLEKTNGCRGHRVAGEPSWTDPEAKLRTTSVLCSVPGVWVYDRVQRGLISVRPPRSPVPNPPRVSAASPGTVGGARAHPDLNLGRTCPGSGPKP